MCEVIISSGDFKILIFWVVSWIKVQKMVQNDKEICLSCSISQEPYIIWFLFMVHICKMIISLGIFLIFPNFDFSGWFFGGKRTKNSPKWQKILSVALSIPGTIHPSGVFPFFLKILIFWVHRGGKKAKNVPEWQKIMSVVLHIPGTIHHMIVIYGTNV